MSVENPTPGDPGVLLATQLAQGDPQALAEIFSQNRERLARLLQFRMDKRLTGRVDAEDILQEAYLAASQRLEGYAKDTARPEPFIWLRLILMQTLIDVHRTHMNTQRRDAAREIAIAGCALDTSDTLALQLVGSATSPSVVVRRQETLETVKRAIESMEPLDREVLALRHFEELSNQETAAVLNIQPKAASIRYVRALERLKEILALLPDDPHA